MPELDDTVLEPDFDTDELPKPPQDDNQVHYGILVYLDTKGEHGMQIIGKEQASLNDLISLVSMASRKLDIIWEAKNNPSAQATLRDLSELKKNQVGTLKSIQSITQILQGISQGLADISTKLDGDIDNVREAKDKV